MIIYSLKKIFKGVNLLVTGCLFKEENKLQSDNKYQSVFVTVQLSSESNRLLSESCKRSNRKKIQEATLRLEDHLKRFRSISEIDHVVNITQ